ncbi:glycosyltransferase family 4 protein [Pseudorhodobacter sp.]|uniref:glycosyltransferase family 4 protein n=1 Tax=Pseudorhodobacter sp. TaxID=1934400 RepID=UPI0026494334|nr:glycosyltransferase family 4 protein [Pseudorhodobacter sp.]MDN5788084.1 glycosyltransferase family 4 protein [Pseudorhodobacter sp.]
MIRVAHIKSNYGHVGGIESMLESLMPEFAVQPGIEPVVIFLSREPDPALEGRLSAGGQVRLIRLPWTGLATSPKTALALGRLVRDENIALLHTHDMRANLSAAMVRVFRRVPWICHIHGWLGATHSRLYRMFEAVDRALMRRADHVLTGSHATLDEVRVAGARAASVVSNAVLLPPPTDHRLARQSVGLPEAGVIFTILGRLHPGKGQDLFLNALSRLPRDMPWQGVIVGSGGEDAILKALAAKLDLGNRLHFTGFVESTAPWIAASDVIAVPSRKESLPLTCLEGMAQGRAVVVSAAGDLPRVVTDGRTGLIVPINDVPALEAAFLRLLLDPDLRNQLGEAARAYIAENNTVSVLARQIATVQRQVASQVSRVVRS